MIFIDTSTFSQFPQNIHQCKWLRAFVNKLSWLGLHLTACHIRSREKVNEWGLSGRCGVASVRLSSDTTPSRITFLSLNISMGSGGGVVPVRFSSWMRSVFSMLRASCSVVRTSCSMVRMSSSVVWTSSSMRMFSYKTCLVNPLQWIPGRKARTTSDSLAVSLTSRDTVVLPKYNSSAETCRHVSSFSLFPSSQAAVKLNS